jgi:hypothetical protein
MTCFTGAGWSNQTAIADGGPVCAKAELISWAFSLVTNATCTMIIGYKAWYIFFPCHLIRELKSCQATSQINQGGKVVGHLG